MSFFSIPSIVFLSPALSLAVAQTRGHIAGRRLLSPVPPLRHAPCLPIAKTVQHLLLHPRRLASNCAYELVQACRLKFRQPRMPHAIATRMSHIAYHADRHEQQRKRVTHVVSLFVKNLELALAPKMCPDQSQAFEEVNNSQAFTVGRKHQFPIFFRTIPLPGAPKHVGTKFRANIRKTDCVGPT